MSTGICFRITCGEDFFTFEQLNISSHFFSVGVPPGEVDSAIGAPPSHPDNRVLLHLSKLERRVGGKHAVHQASHCDAHVCVVPGGNLKEAQQVLLFDKRIVFLSVDSHILQV